MPSTLSKQKRITREERKSLQQQGHIGGWFYGSSLGRPKKKRTATVDQDDNNQPTTLEVQPTERKRGKYTNWCTDPVNNKILEEAATCVQQGDDLLDVQHLAIPRRTLNRAIDKISTDGKLDTESRRSTSLLTETERLHMCHIINARDQ